MDMLIISAKELVLSEHDLGLCSRNYLPKTFLFRLRESLRKFFRMEP